MAYGQHVAANERVLVLWDVDGTLIHNGGVSKEAYALGFERLAGRASTVTVVTDGMTDGAIMASLFERNGLEMTADQRERLYSVMSSALGSLAPQLRERGRAMPGAVEALDALAADTRVVQSALTGNIAPNAFTKLSAFGLHKHIDFEVGGFGSDDIDRNKLVPIARRKASAKYGVEFTAETTVIIGDTPRDVEAGRTGGAYVLAVASGAFGADELAALGADLVLADLTDTQEVVDAVLSRPRLAF